MNLPDLALQIVYGRLAWALVIAAVLLAVLPMLLRRFLPAVASDVPRRTQALVVAVSVVLMALPGEASPAYWLALVFQYPSGLLLGYSLVSLYGRWHGEPVRFAMPAGFALVLAVVGVAMYLEAFGLLSLGLYYGGFGATTAPLLACTIAAVSAVAVISGRARGASGALLIGVLLFSLFRLPTGNLWDALFDPLIWSWAMASAIAAAQRMAAARKAARQPAQAEPGLEPVADLEPAHASGIE